MDAREPCQIRNEAALSDSIHVPLVTWLFFNLGTKIAFNFIIKLRSGRKQ
jgi:hypothetical protein